MEMEKRTQMNKEIESKIQKIRDEFGDMLFRMGLWHLIDIGISKANKITQEDIDEFLAEETARQKEDEINGKFSIISPEYKTDIIKVAMLLSKFNISDILKYVTNYIYID